MSVARARSHDGRRAVDGPVVAATSLFALHVALVFHFTPAGLFSLSTPLLGSAFALDAYRLDRALAALHAHGSFAAYDPRVLAGQTAGLWEPLGSRLGVLLCAAATRLGVDPVRAFDVRAVVCHAVVPLVGYVAARARGASRGVATGVLATWSALTFVDGLTHYAWFSGRIELLLACALGVALAAFLDRAAVNPGRAAFAAAAVAGVLTWLAAPCVGVLASLAGFVPVVSTRALPVRRRVTLAAVALAPTLVLAMISWSAGAVTSEPVSSVFRVGPSSLLWDVVAIPGPGNGAAGSASTTLRVACIGAGLLGLARRRRVSAVGALAVSALFVAYAGSLVPVPWPADPYFFGIAAAFAAALPAAELVSGVSWRALFRAGPTNLRVVLLAATAIAIPRAVRDVLRYAPELLPSRVVRGPSDYAVSSLGGIDEPFPDPLGYDPPPLNALAALSRYLTANGASRGRVVTDDAAVAGFLALHGSFEVLGPLGERGAPSAAADPTTLLESGDARAVAAYVERYAVGFVVLAGPRGHFDEALPFLDAPSVVNGYRVRRVMTEPSRIAEGVARVETVGGSLRVRGAAGPRVTLRYHHVPGLACRPGCVVERVASGDGGPGFVSVANPPSEFEIYAL